jgi:hypothetical protein
MNNRLGANVIEFPAEYLTEQRKLDRWMAITSCSIVMGSDEPMACVEMILDRFHDVRNPADIIAYARFAAKPFPEALIEPEGIYTAASVATETVFNEWIDAWLLSSQH